MAATKLALCLTLLILSSVSITCLASLKGLEKERTLSTNSLIRNAPARRLSKKSSKQHHTPVLVPPKRPAPVNKIPRSKSTKAVTLLPSQKSKSSKDKTFISTLKSKSTKEITLIPTLKSKSAKETTFLSTLKSKSTKGITLIHTQKPTPRPTYKPTPVTTLTPTVSSSSFPSFKRTLTPTSGPTSNPSSTATTLEPTFGPTFGSTPGPTLGSTSHPSVDLTLAPSPAVSVPGSTASSMSPFPGQAAGTTTDLEDSTVTNEDSWSSSSIILGGALVGGMVGLFALFGGGMAVHQRTRKRATVETEWDDVSLGN
jgi:hypothetical protein